MNKTHDSGGRFASKDTPPPSLFSTGASQDSSVKVTVRPNPTPPIVNFQVNNPVLYLKYWWKKIMNNEGIDLRLRARPLTVFGVALIAFSLAFGLGGVVLPFAIPGLKFNNKPTTAPSSVPAIVWKDTALKGILKSTTSTPPKFYLLGSSDEAITLEVPATVNLTALIGKRILAIGTYDSSDKILKVIDVQDLEVLSTTPLPIPTSTPTPVPTPSPTIQPTVEPTIVPTEVPSPTP